MIRGAEQFKHRLLEAGIKDEGCHHEFKTGIHGEKLEFEIVTPGSDLWDVWVDLTARLIRKTHSSPAPPVLESTANGTLDFTDEVAGSLNRYGNYDEPVHVIHTEKTEEDGKPRVRLSETAKRTLWKLQAKVIFKIDDAATTGSSTASTTADLRAFGAEEIRAYYTWMRNPALPYLDDARVAYYGLIDNHPLPDYSPADCLDHGFCSMPGNVFIPYGEAANY